MSQFNPCVITQISIHTVPKDSDADYTVIVDMGGISIHTVPKDSDFASSSLL